MYIVIKFYAAIITALLCLQLLACSSPAYTRILWPKPPDKPKLEFIGVYKTSEDFDLIGFDKLVNNLFDDTKYFFKMPYGIVTNDQGDVYISDIEGLKVVNRSNKTVSKIVSVDVVKQPLGITTDSKGRIYIADGKAKTVIVLSENGGILQQFGDGTLFDRPSYIAVNERLHRVYVSDKNKNVINVFDMAGKLITKIGKPGKDNGEFAFPQGIAIAANNDIYVADMLNRRIQVFNADGLFIRSFGQGGGNYRDFDAPRDLAFGPDGHLYIVDFRKALLYVYSVEGELLLVLGDHKKRTNHPLGFSSPSSIHIDKRGRIFITDMLNHRYSVWQILTSDYLSNHPIGIE